MGLQMKEKKALLDEFVLLTGYHRKSVIRVLDRQVIKSVLLYSNGKAFKVKPEKRKASNRTGKRLYSDEVIDSLRLVWAFFWYK